MHETTPRDCLDYAPGLACWSRGYEWAGAGPLRGRRDQILVDCGHVTPSSPPKKKAVFTTNKRVADAALVR